ncbi:hypothetical protein [Streptomyces sp. CRN 30]|uniref:hypothetical protein n=1 Tax=Streptomyces sp. CRN 30 TaxID=3075613 RepID=UPI002A7EC277|nr:hypothetical protein [Streptomyces sp. CRN 30]
MRLSRSLAPASAAAVLLLGLPYTAVPHARAGTAGERPARVVDGPPHARVRDGPRATREPSGAECRTGLYGSRVVVYCHNAYADPDRLRLHIECERWWDIDTDGPPVEAGPARTVRLTGRCWHEVRSAWVSHER